MSIIPSNQVNTYDVFVYGTLRRAGDYHRLYLRYSPCLRDYYLLFGYALYDYEGLYPFMVPESEAWVVGEVYRINQSVKDALDEFEDVGERLYEFVYLPEHEFYTYVKTDPHVGNMPRVPHGDWFIYCSGE